MTYDDFQTVMEEIITNIRTVEHEKCQEYVNSVEPDRLAHFKEVGAILGWPAHQALAGMMVKHTKSIYDMIKSKNLSQFKVEKWNEKIIDHIGYPMLLRAMVEEERSQDGTQVISRPVDNDSKSHQFPCFNR